MSQFSSLPADRLAIIRTFRALCLRTRWRSRKPLPILTLLAPPGGGTSVAINDIASALNNAKPWKLPYFRIDDAFLARINEDADILDLLVSELGTLAPRNFRRVHFPRYHFYKWLANLKSGQNPAVDDIERALQRREGEFHQVMDELALVPAQLLQAIPPFFRLLRQWSLHWWRVPRWAFWGRVLDWFEDQQKLLTLPGDHHIQSVLSRMYLWQRSTLPEHVQSMQRLRLSAALEDLRVAYWPKSWRWKARGVVPCIILVDVSDLKNNEARQLRVLLRDLLSLRNAGTIPDPLLIVISSNQRPFPSANLPHPWFGPNVQDFDVTPDARHSQWYGQLPIASEGTSAPWWRWHLPMWRHRLSREEIAGSISGTRPVTPELLDEAERSTMGHPSAVAELYGPGSQSASGRTSPEQENFDAEGSNSREILLASFTKGLHRDELNRDQLAACAAARRCDPSSVRVSLDLRSGGRRIWEKIGRYAFTELDSSGKVLAWHPLLSDLLVDWLASRPVADPLSFPSVHRRLADHWKRRYRRVIEDRATSDLTHESNEQAEFRLEWLYHELAMGNITEVVEDIANRLYLSQELWLSQLEQIASAPLPGRSTVENAQLAATQALRAAEDDSENVETCLTAIVLLQQLSSSRLVTSPDRETILWRLTSAYRLLARATGGFGELGFTRHRDQTPQGRRSTSQREDSVVATQSSRRSHRVLTQIRWRRPIQLKFTVAALVLLVLSTGCYIGYYYRIYLPGTCTPTNVVNIPGVFTRNPDLWRSRQGECIGISDGQYQFDKASKIEKEIAEENSAVERYSAQNDWPFVTVVLVTRLTSAALASDEALRAARAEAHGVHLAQVVHNGGPGKWPRSTPQQPLLKILIANAGQRFQHADFVAEQIVRRAAVDHRLVAVLGLGQSSAQTKQAIQRLSAAGIPMVVTTSTGDDLTEKSPTFFRIAPTNQRQADVAVYYAAVTLRRVWPAIVVDRDDSYSNTLAEDLVRAWGRRPDSRNPRLYEFNRNNGNSIWQATEKLCPEGHDVLFFTGRVEDLERLLRDLGFRGCRSMEVLAGDDTARRASEVVPRAWYGKVRYTALAHMDAWRSKTVVQGPAQFLEDYRKVFSEPLSDLNHVGLGFDATSVLGQALVGVHTYGDASEPLDRRHITTSLAATKDFPGVTGLINFKRDSVNGGFNSDGKVVTLMEVGKDGKIRLLEVCGHLTRGYGSAFRCGR